MQGNEKMFCLIIEWYYIIIFNISVSCTIILSIRISKSDSRPELQTYLKAKEIEEVRIKESKGRNEFQTGGIVLQQQRRWWDTVISAVPQASKGPCGMQFPGWVWEKTLKWQGSVRREVPNSSYTQRAHSEGHKHNSVGELLLRLQ